MKDRYEVTEKAGPFVAGRRSPGAGEPIDLTPDEAHYPLMAGEIKRPTAGGQEEPQRVRRKRTDGPEVEG